MGLTVDCSLSGDVKCWPLFVHDPLPTWVYGKVVLIGDSAHPVWQRAPFEKQVGRLTSKS